MFGVIAFNQFSANAAGFNKTTNNNGQVVSANQFYKILDNTKSTDVAVKFGMPDSISTLKDANGAQAGVVWTYKDAVAKDNDKLDANFVFVAGEFKYVTLSNS
jgi:hypothetical protein